MSTEIDRLLREGRITREDVFATDSVPDPVVRNIWVVVLDTGGASGPHVFGPFEDEGVARDFAASLAAEGGEATHTGSTQRRRRRGDA